MSRNRSCNLLVCFFVVLGFAIYFQSAQISFAFDAEKESPSFEIIRNQESSTYVTKTITIISQKEIAESPERTVTGILKYRAGLDVTGFGVDIRGAGETASQNILVLIDGRRVNPIDMSGTSWSAIPLGIVERIEIIRGSANVLYGDNAANGVINIVTKKIEEEVHFCAVGEWGEGRYKTANTLTAANEFSEGLLYFNNLEDNGGRDNSSYWGNDWFGKGTIFFSDDVRLKLSAGHHRDRVELPGAIFINDMKRLGRYASTHSDDHSWSEETFFTATPEWTIESAKNEVALSAFASFRSKQSKADYSGYHTKNDITSLEWQPKISWTTRISENINSKLTTGTDFYYGANDIGDARIHKNSVGFYGLENLTFFERFLLNAGARGEWAKYDFKEIATNAKSETSTRNTALDLGTGYKYNERSITYIDFSKGFRSPVTDEFYSVWTGLNKNLKPQRSTNYEIGVRDNTYEPLKISLNAFLADAKNEIYYDPITFENKNYLSPTRRMGVEFEGSVKLFDKEWYQISPFLNATWQRTRFKGGDYSDKRVPFVPNNKMVFGIAAEPVKNLTLSLAFNHTGAQFPISDQLNRSEKIKPYTTADFKTQYKWENVSVWLMALNLFDSKYIDYATRSSSGAVGYYPASGRNVIIGMSVEY